MERRLWSREELLVALNLYLKLPFGKMHSRNPEVIRLADLLERSPNAIAMRLTNFASVDPFQQKRGIKGLTGGIRQVQPIWDEFEHDREAILFESEQMVAELEEQRIETKYAGILQDTRQLEGETRIREVRTRVNQQIFRQIVLANYSGQCAISGIDIPGLLVASHIIPWSSNAKERLNPANGICLSAHFDAAFDKGYLYFDPNYRLRLSQKLLNYSDRGYYAGWFGQFEGKQLEMPVKYLPNPEFLEWHREHVCRQA